MATQPRFYNDGNWVVGFNYGADKVTYPFLNYPNSDTNTKLYEVTRAFLPVNYVPQSALALYSGNPNTYLVDEGEMAIDQMARAKNMLRFSMIPPVAYSYPGSRYFQLPAIQNTYGASTSLPVIISNPYSSSGTGVFDLENGAIYIGQNQNLYGPTKIQTARLIGLASGGTFTLTFGANTTGALNWNDTGATIAAAVNGLASVIAAGLTATVNNSLANASGGYLSIGWSGSATATPLTLNGGSLTVTTSNHPTTTVISGVLQTILLADHYTIASHGFNTALDMASVTAANNIYLMTAGYWGSINSNTIWAPTSITSQILYFGTFLSSYLPGGTYLMRCQVVETYYLPGISPGITTPGDILAPIGLQNTSAFVGAFMTLTGFQTYQSEGPQPWLGTRIYFVREIQLNFDDI